MSGDNRAAHRRRRRAEQKQPVLIAGDGIVASDLGHEYEAKPRAELPEKIPGRHRWIATAAWAISRDIVDDAYDPDRLKHLDAENLIVLAIGCWDCEQNLGQITADSTCPGEVTP